MEQALYLLHHLPSLVSFFLNFMCMDVLLECMSMYNMHPWCPWRPEEGMGSPETGVNEHLAMSCHVSASN